MPRRPSRWSRRPSRRSAVFAIVLLVSALWGYQVWRLSTSVAATARYWDQPRGEPGGLVYVALGDSAAQGIGASSPERGYVGLLAAQLARSSGRPVQVVNLSRSGAKVRDVVRDQLPRLAGLRADLVTVDVGGNDIRRYDAAAYLVDIDQLVRGLPPGAVLADIPYFMHGRAQRDAEQAADVIRELGQRRGLVVAPLQQALQARGWAGMFTDYAADWFHPNNRGHRVWAAAFWGEIAGLPVARPG